MLVKLPNVCITSGAALIRRTYHGLVSASVFNFVMSQAVKVQAFHKVFT